MNTDFNTPEYKRYRKAYMTQCTLEHLIWLLVSDAFLAKLLTHIGMSDAFVGVITSFASVAFVFQLLSVFLVQSKISTKKIVTFTDVVSQMSFMLMFFVPFIPLAGTAKKIVVMAAVMIGHAAKSTILTLYYKWANAYVEDSVRATFSAKKEMLSLICGMVFSAFMGLIVDKYESIGNLKGGFLFIALTMLVINIANFISFMLIKDESREKREDMRVPFRELFAHIYSNKLFFRYLIISCVGSIGGGFFTGFVGIYKIKELALSVFVIQLINILADFVRMAVSIPFAKYSNRLGFARGIQLAEILIGISYAIFIFTIPSTAWLIVPYTFLYSAAQAGSYQNSFNIGYTLLSQKYMSQGIAIRGVLTGSISFISAIFGGKILSAVQANGNMIFGFHIYGQQLLALIALAIWIPVFILRNKYVTKPIDKILAEKKANDCNKELIEER